MKQLGLGLALTALASAASAQNLMPVDRIEPVTEPIVDAGVLDWVTGRWYPSGSSLIGGPGALAPRVIYDNTCGGGTTAAAPCEDFYDEGRIPSPTSPNAPVGVTADNQVTSFKFGYCTRYPAGQVDMKVAFFNVLNMPCVGGTAPTPPPWSTQATAYFDFGAAAGYPLPGSAFLGANSCHTVTISNVNFCLQSDGDGLYDGLQQTDLFAFAMTSPNPMIGTLKTQFFIRGNPSLGAPGACTYNIPCGGTATNPCGTGLDTSDNWWINQDNVAVGGTTPCTGGATGGTGCYWFGGYQNGFAFASFYMHLESPGACGCLAGFSYCTSKISSSGCVPVMFAQGQPSLTNPGLFTVSASQLEDNQNGLMFFGTTGQNNFPFQGGFQCVSIPLHRLLIQNTGGSGPCTGGMAYNLGDFLAQPTGGPLIIVGATVNVQTWFRDPLSPSTTGLSDGWEFPVCP
jgi:hypothetical protein